MAFICQAPRVRERGKTKDSGWRGVVVERYTQGDGF